jgi:hypothetical protein
MQEKIENEILKERDRECVCKKRDRGTMKERDARKKKILKERHKKDREKQWDII